MTEHIYCPFCGKNEAYTTHEDCYGNLSEYWMIACDNPNCWLQFGFASQFETEEEVIAAWNTRTEPEPRALTVEELREMDGKPVWNDCMHRWCICEKHDVSDEMILCFATGGYQFASHLIGQIYDRQPKGE